MNKKGNVVIEAAIAFSITLLLVATIANTITVYRTDILMQRALTKTCNDFSLLTPLSVTSSDMVSTLVNAAPDSSAGVSSTMQEVLTTLAGFDLATGNSLTSTVLNSVLARRFEVDIANEYVRFNDGSSFLCPDYIYVEFDVDLSRCVILVNMSYEIETLTGTVTRNLTSGIPFYGDMELFLSGEGAVEDEENIWDYHNFKRGEKFIEMYGGNLPSTYPVIDYWDGSTAKSITSINTASASYSDISAFDKRVIDDIDSLSSFNGADVNISGNRYVVDGNDIQNRELLVIVPSNCDERYLQELDLLAKYANNKNVGLLIEQYGEV